MYQNLSIDDLCGKIPTKYTDVILKNFGTLINYRHQCEFFARFDCETFDPVTVNFGYLAKQIWGYIGGIFEGGNCIGKIIKANPGFVPSLKKLFEEKVIDKIFEDGSDLALHAATLGIWGGIKAAYHLVKLGFQIKEFFEGLEKDTAYSIGKIVGKVIKIVKSLLFGRRKKFKK